MHAGAADRNAAPRQPARGRGHIRSGVQVRGYEVWGPRRVRRTRTLQVLKSPDSSALVRVT